MSEGSAAWSRQTASDRSTKSLFYSTASSSSASGIAAPSSISNSSGLTAPPILVVTDPTGTSKPGCPRNNRLQLLPSSRYSHTRWHELSENGIRGHELKAPRVREGPAGIREFSAKLDYRNKVENWENASVSFYWKIVKGVIFVCSV
eukprot:m.44023 g.44023  ORF g.44023 m.44023 type:complete len:147 (+) comp33486_c0_seq8:132-572(+)